MRSVITFCLLIIVHGPALYAQSPSVPSSETTTASAQLPEALRTESTSSVPGASGRQKSALAHTPIGTLVTETLPDLGLKIKQAKKEHTERRKKIKQSLTEYEGIAIEEASTKFGSGERTIIEKFTVLKQYRQPSIYVRDIHWYDAKGQRVSSSVIKDKEQAHILHGPYKRYQNGNLVEEGFYYMGAKDGRWEKYDVNFMLLDKTKFHRGFPAESQIIYFDSAHTKIKEVLPKEHGRLHGNYWAFYEGGQLAAEGRYDHGVKVGRWTEYYQFQRRKKKITQYGRDRWEEDFEPYVLSEWDDKGKLIYERPKEETTAEEEQ